MNKIRRVNHGTRHLAVSTTEHVPGLPVNVLITTEDHAGRISERLGLSMSRESAETVRDALTEALEATKPAPTKAERILSALIGHAARSTVKAILDEDGPL